MSETLLDDANPEARQPFFTTAIFLGSLVAVLTICTAVAAFQASRLAVDAGTAGGQSVRALLESNAAFLGADQVTSSDFTLFGLSLEAENADAQQFYETGFSPALRLVLGLVGGGHAQDATDVLPLRSRLGWCRRHRLRLGRSQPDLSSSYR